MDQLDLPLRVAIVVGTEAGTPARRGAQTMEDLKHPNLDQVGRAAARTHVDVSQQGAVIFTA